MSAEHGRWIRTVATAATAVAVVAVVAGEGRASALGATQRASVSMTGGDPNQASSKAQVSASGRFVLFMSRATNLVPNDTNGATDVFERDLLTATTKLVSYNTAGVPATGGSRSGVMSADGRFVVFQSDAQDLGPTPQPLPPTEPCRRYPPDVTASQLFWRDLVTGVTQRVDQSTSGVLSDSAYNYAPSVSADGRYVAFVSLATNLVPGDTNCWRDIFVRDTQLGTTIRASVDTAGQQANNANVNPAISADGHVVSFRSLASNLVAGDVNQKYDIFWRDLVRGVTVIVSVSTAGVQSDASAMSKTALSGDGRYVTFQSTASNLVAGDTNAVADVFVRDVLLGTTTRVSTSATGAQLDRSSLDPSISDDGLRVVFESDATNVVPNDTNSNRDIFVADMTTGARSRVSTSRTGGNASGKSELSAISADGTTVVFQSSAANLVAGDTNGRVDVFARTLG